VNAPRQPFESRRRLELRRELVERARAWLSDWRPRADGGDFALGLLETAARLESEVTQRLDRIPAKVYRGFLHWIGLRPDAGRAARLPVVFQMAPGAEPVLARRPIQMQTTPAQTDTGVAPEPVTLETDADLMVSRGSLAALVAVNPSGDEFFLAADNVYGLEPPAAAPDAWRAVSDVGEGSTQLQLEPELGLAGLPTLRHALTGKQYRVIKAEGTLVTLEPPLEHGVAEDDAFERVSAFAPFAKGTRNRQEHALYVGSESVLNLPTDATISVLGLEAVGDAEWSYWGKAEGSDTDAWQALPTTRQNQRVVLAKRAGAVEIRDVGGRQSRWLRAMKKSPISEVTPPVSRIQLTVNCNPGGTATACPPAKPSTVAVEGIAVTTPLVLDIPFYPLGREPRLFDAFYLGSPEAFSKKNAQVNICLESLDSTTSAYAAARLATGPDVMLFGVSHGQLHRVKPLPASTQSFERPSSVRPPFDENGTASVPAPSSPLNDLREGAKVSTLARAVDTLVAVTSGNDGWLWLQQQQPGQSRWFHLGPIFAFPTVPAPDPAEPPQVLLLKDGTGVRLLGLNHQRLFELSLPAGWEASGSVPPWREVDNGSIGWTRMVAVLDADPGAGGNMDNGWVAMDDAGDLHVFARDNAGNSTWDRRLGLRSVDPAPAPLAIRLTPGETVLCARQGDRLTAWSVSNDQRIATLNNARVYGVLDWVADPTPLFAVVFRRKTRAETYELAAWFPIAARAGAAPAGSMYVSGPLARSNGGPAGLPDRLVVPGTSGAVIAVPFTPGGLTLTDLGKEKVESALVFSGNKPFAIDDYLLTQIEGGPVNVTQLTQDPIQNGPNRYWTRLSPADVEKPFERAEVYRLVSSEPLSGKVLSSTPEDSEIELKAGDVGGLTHRFIAVTVGGTTSIHEIEPIEPPPNPPPDPLVITVKPAVAGSPGNISYEYVKPTATTSVIVPLLHVTDLNADLRENLVANGVYLKGALPAPNQVLFPDPPAGAIDKLILAEEWDPDHRPTLSGGQVSIVQNSLYGQPSTLEEPKTGNPTLSWEYWDGTAWWKIPGLVDGTNNLQSTGTVRFCVPESLQPTDVAGRTSHWIRARLIGGDYGKEQVTIVSKTEGNPPITTQTVNRSLDAIKPPQMASVNLSYSVCCASWPDFVLTRDGNAVRDQSAANRTDGASVELFVPLSETIRRAAAGTSTPQDLQRALYLGFDGRLEGGPIGVLFLVNEGNHDLAFPLEVDVLGERGFEPVIASDGTRGLNESGILAFSLAAAPPAVALFGAEARYWLRVRPNSQFKAAWQPGIRAAFLNGAWAVASETQPPERLGSSDGSPGQRVTVARPPVIADSLELRVREPLGDEEIEELNRAAPGTVIDPLPNGLPGTWVLWKKVDNLVDGTKDERIYTLDASEGTITFGDGRHGRIPPIGVDSIVAVSYKRGGGDAANDIVAWSQVNLISAIQGVQAVIAPEGAAGGSDPQTADEVVRFAPATLAMRDRALTLQDLEVLAVQSSRDVAQARAFPSPGGARLTVVMRGRDPLPPQPVIRAVRRYLAERTTPMLAAPNAIDVRGPVVVDLRIALALTIDAVENSGAVAAEAQRRVAALLDPADGGVDEAGWRLGDVPGEADIAAVLADVPHLEEIRSIEVRVASTGDAATAVARDAIVRLADNGVTTAFAVLEGSPA
jgi:hypothetical protein